MSQSKTSKALLTLAECAQILAKSCGPQCQLKDFKLERATDVVGFLGEYYILEMRYSQPMDENRNVLEDSGGQQIKKIFIKSMPTDSIEEERKVAFHKEALLYAELLTPLQECVSEKWSPQCYFTRDNLLALEHLPSEGYSLSSSVPKPLNTSQVQQILRALVSLHAASIAYEHQHHINIGHKFEHLLTEITIAPQIPWYTTGLRAITAVAQAHPKFQSEELQHFIRAEMPGQLNSIYAMMGPSSRYRNVLCHRDPWRGNIFFHDSQKSAVLVDFQTCRYCPPAVDLIYCLFVNLDSAERKESESMYLHWYYQQLRDELQRCSAGGVDVQTELSERQLLESYREFRLFGFAYKCMVWTLLGVPREMVTENYKLIDRVPMLLQYMKENDTFRSSMHCYIEELLEIMMKV